MEKLLLIDKVTDNPIIFDATVRSIAKEIGINPSWLMAVMYFESRLNPKAVNKYTNATGLIQFMPTTAKGLGTTTTDLLKMSNVEQLKFVKAYFKPFTGKLKTLGDTYLAVFYPALIGKAGDTVLPAKVQEQNPVFKPYWINGKLMKDSIVNYFLNFFKGFKPALPFAAVGIFLILILLINQS